ncbi:hypothetical protein PARHAE_02058 [Paracoccus haematequi]|uniref:DUF3168 domain-containing protein n=1 Tax=Paracoccus haematequi TaxID=2491866 RepID=A0A3S4GR38_9RHOB|nr:phage tail terminator-like protein [Paracoccus haematequi]VDS08873.1 hypothetical protein PARHAE_02058 [Paracoccus haematequi]
MTPSGIQNAIGQHLLAAFPRIVWPNRTTPLPARPYLVMQNAARSDTDRALAGGKGYSEGRQIVVVVADLNAFATSADDLAATIRARFPRALRLGRLTIVRSQVLPGYTTDTDYRVPVSIDWIAV